MGDPVTKSLGAVLEGPSLAFVVVGETVGTTSNPLILGTEVVTKSLGAELVTTSLGIVVEGPSIEIIIAGVSVGA